MGKTIAQLRRELAEEKAKVSVLNSFRKSDSEKTSLRKKLFALKHRRTIKVVKMVGSGAKRVGRGLGRVARKGYSAYQKAEKGQKKSKRKSNNFGGLPDYSAFAGY